jgi:hypothetical protein
MSHNNNLLIAEDTVIYKPNLESIKERGESITPHDFLFIAKLTKDRNKMTRDHGEMLYNQFCAAVALYYLDKNPIYKGKFTVTDYCNMLGYGNNTYIQQYLGLAEYFDCDYEKLKAFGLEHKTRSVRKLYAYTKYGVNSERGRLEKYRISLPTEYEQIIRDIKADRLNLGNEKKAPEEKHYHLYRLKRAVLANFASYKPLDNLDFLSYYDCFICNRTPTDHDKNVVMSVNVGRHINLPICKKCVPKRELSIKNNKSKLISVIQLLVNYTKLLEEIIDASSGAYGYGADDNQVARILSNKNYKINDEKVLHPKKTKTPELGYKFGTNKSKNP